jgi:hypothetical protein
MNITAISKQGQEDEFVFRMSDTDAKFMLAALMRRYPNEMCMSLMDMVNDCKLEDLPKVTVEAISTEKGANLPLDKFCLGTAIKLLTAKRSITLVKEDE